MIRRFIYLLILIFFLFVCVSCSSLVYGGRQLNIATILKNPKQFINKTVELEVRMGGNCWWVRRQGNICITDGIKSLCALGKLPKEIPTRPGERSEKESLSWEELKKKKLWVKGIIKAVSNRQVIGKADNVVGGKITCAKENCAVTGGLIVYIEVIDARFIDDSP